MTERYIFMTVAVLIEFTILIVLYVNTMEYRPESGIYRKDENIRYLLIERIRPIVFWAIPIITILFYVFIINSVRIEYKKYRLDVISAENGVNNYVLVSSNSAYTMGIHPMGVIGGVQYYTSSISEYNYNEYYVLYPGDEKTTMITGNVEIEYEKGDSAYIHEKYFIFKYWHPFLDNKKLIGYKITLPLPQ